ncbi:MAG TPA: OmpA family protein [Salinimicrobium sp.]|nr:OmpA family protein [Salinimicrobium sp.]
MKRIITVTALAAITLTSCVSKKKYVALQEDYNTARTNLQETQIEKEKLAAKLGAIEERVSDYNAKINTLTDENYEMLDLNDVAAMSEANKDAMRATLEKVDDSLLNDANTLQDSINIAVAYNLERQINADGENDDVQVSVDETVVMVNLSDELLFNSGSARVSRDAYPTLEKLAEVINSEPAMEVLVEGHTDSRTVVEDSYLIDNWDLSVRRAAAVVRLLQNKFGVDPEKMIAAGRSSYQPVAEGDTAEARAKNRRTRIVILPNLNKFLALLDSETQVSSTNTEMNSETEMDGELDAEPQTEINNEVEEGID